MSTKESSDHAQISDRKKPNFEVSIISQQDGSHSKPDDLFYFTPKKQSSPNVDEFDAPN